MNIIIYVFSTFFVLMALAVMFAFYRTRHYGLFLIGLAYGVSAVLALVLMHWGPLAAGIALAWAMKLAGLEPEVGGQAKSGERSKIRES